jgi:hypothetical protein
LQETAACAFCDGPTYLRIDAPDMLWELPLAEAASDPEAPSEIRWSGVLGGLTWFFGWLFLLVLACQHTRDLRWGWLVCGFVAVQIAGLAWAALRSKPEPSASLPSKPKTPAPLLRPIDVQRHGKPTFARLRRDARAVVQTAAGTEAHLYLRLADPVELDVDAEDRGALRVVGVALVVGPGKLVERSIFGEWAALLPAVGCIERTIRAGDRVALYGVPHDEQVADGYRDRKQLVLRGTPERPIVLRHAPER